MTISPAGTRGSGGPSGPALPRVFFPWLTLCLGLTAGIVALLPDTAALLQYDRAAIARGEFWRVVTGHWTHWTGEHFVWDAAVLVVLGAICERYGRRPFLAFVIGASLLVSLAVWAGLPGMALYRGLSGIDAGLYLMAIVVLAREERENGAAWAVPCAVVMAAAFLGKVGFETATGRTLFVQSSGSFVPVPLAHLAGGLAGAVTGFAVALRTGTGVSPSLTPSRPDSRPCGRRTRSVFS